MLTSNNIFEERVIARDALKGIYSCPACGGATILKKGEKKIAHFAHQYLKKPLAFVGDCWWESESIEHLSFKQKLYDYYTDKGFECQLEKIVDDGKFIKKPLAFVLDVAIEYKGQKVAIEIQLSETPIERVIEKTIALNKLGYYVLWLIGDPALKSHDDRSSQLLYLMHSRFYFGRVYTITSQFTVKSNFGVNIDPEMEVSALYLKYRTKTIISRKHYFPLIDLNILCTETAEYSIGKIKIARFCDKHIDKNSLD